MNSKSLRITENRPALGKEEEKLSPPSMYTVVILNDDYTPMDFVVEILISNFCIPQQEAYNMMLSIHNNGRAVYGSYTKDVAETKAYQINYLARSLEYPLLSVVEKHKTLFARRLTYAE